MCFIFPLFIIWPDKNQKFGLNRSSSSERRYLRLPALARSQAKHVGFGHIFMTVMSLLTRKWGWALWLLNLLDNLSEKLPLIWAGSNLDTFIFFLSTSNAPASVCFPKFLPSRVHIPAVLPSIVWKLSSWQLCFSAWYLLEARAMLAIRAHVHLTAVLGANGFKLWDWVKVSCSPSCLHRHYLCLKKKKRAFGCF